MKAAVIPRYGSNDLVEVVEVEKPSPGPRDVSIRVMAASVNPLDWKIREGKAKALLPYRFPLILGNDLSGVIEATGPEVTRFKPGDEVYVRLGKRRIGAFAEYAVADESEVALKPRNLSHVEAASIPLIGLTTWQALVEIGRLQAGQKVFIQAGSGGVGSFAIQLARKLGAQVATTTSTRNIDLVRKLGADVVIDYKSQRFEEVLKDIDLVYDTMGGDELTRGFSVLKRGGLLVSIAALPDFATARAQGMNPLLASVLVLANLPIYLSARRRGVRYRYLFMRADGEQLARITTLIEQGHIKPLIDKVYPLEQVREALAHVESGRARGKVVIQIG